MPTATTAQCQQQQHHDVSSNSNKSSTMLPPTKSACSAINSIKCSTRLPLTATAAKARQCCHQQQQKQNQCTDTNKNKSSTHPPGTGAHLSENETLLSKTFFLENPSQRTVSSFQAHPLFFHLEATARICTIS